MSLISLKLTNSFACPKSRQLQLGASKTRTTMLLYVSPQQSRHIQIRQRHSDGSNCIIFIIEQSNTATRFATKYALSRSRSRTRTRHDPPLQLQLHCIKQVPTKATFHFNNKWRARVDAPMHQLRPSSFLRDQGLADTISCSGRHMKTELRGWKRSL
jgi:hypothetical protein